MRRLSVSDYKGVKFSRNIIALYFNRLLLQIGGASTLAIFLPIFFYTEFGKAIHAVILIYLLIFIAHGLLAPFGAKLLVSMGIRRLMMISVLFVVIAIFALFFWDVDPMVALIFYVTFIVFYKVLYWVPYHVDFAKFTDKATRGRQMSVLLNASQVVLTISPALAGVVIAFFGFDSLFLLSVVISFISILPLFLVDRTYEEFSFGYTETFQKLISRDHRSLLLAYIGDGAQGVITVVIWPIFIFTILDGKYIAVGIVSSLTVFALIVLRFVIGDIIDKWGRQKVLTLSSILYTTGWIFKVFIETGFQIFLVDTYHNVGKVVNRLSFDASTYDQMADNGHYIDEFTVLKEIALNCGRVLMLILILGLTAFFNIQVAFIVAAFATLLMTLLNRRIHIQGGEAPGHLPSHPRA